MSIQRVRFFILLIILLHPVLLAVHTCQAQAAYPSNTDESKVPPYTLPDVLTMKNGKEVSSSKEWMTIQRPYIYRLYEENQFGRYPVKKIPVRFRLLESDKNALEGTALRKQVRIYLHPSDTTVYMDVLIYLPHTAKAQVPVPVFVGYNFSGNHTILNDEAILLPHSWVSARSKGAVHNRATAASRGAGADQWQVKEILSQGFGIVTAYYGDLEPDTTTGWETGIRTTLKKALDIRPDEWSAMGAWAWGLSRIYDYLQTDKHIDAAKAALIGHSRLGKAALWAAASDTRFSLIVSNESGEGGASLSKRWYGETVKIINQKFPYWFAAKYKTYGDNADALPIDGHMLLSLVGPQR